MEDSPHLSVFSDESWFVDRFAQQLDVNSNWPTDAVNVTGSYGPTLGVLVRATAVRDCGNGAGSSFFNITQQ